MLKNRLALLLGCAVLGLGAAPAWAESNLGGLQLRFDEPAGRRFTDYSGSGHTIKPVGTVWRSGADKVRGSSVCFGGNGYLEVEAAPDFAFAGDLTIDFWFKSSHQGRQHALSIGGYSFENIDFDFADGDIATDGKPVGFWLYWNGSGGNKITSGTRFQYVDGQWRHVAMVRSNGVITSYLNGVSVGTSTYSGVLGSAAHPVAIGAQLNNGAVYRAWHGCIDELRIINGRALWTSNFNPDFYLPPPLTACQ
jgi:hypothetical protein